MRQTLGQSAFQSQQTELVSAVQWMTNPRTAWSRHFLVVKCLQKRSRRSRASDALPTAHQESGAELSASILQAFLRTRPGTGVRPTGRRCSSGRHSRSICLFSLPWGRRSGEGEPLLMLDEDDASHCLGRRNYAAVNARRRLTTPYRMAVPLASFCDAGRWLCADSADLLPSL